jgi:hypothetical protein
MGNEECYRFTRVDRKEVKEFFVFHLEEGKRYISACYDSIGEISNDLMKRLSTPKIKIFRTISHDFEDAKNQPYLLINRGEVSVIGVSSDNDDLLLLARQLEFDIAGRVDLEEMASSVSQQD